MRSRITISAWLISSGLLLTRIALAAPASLYPLAVLNDNPSAYWRLDEAGGNMAKDCVCGHDCLLTNVQLGAPGYSAADPDTAAAFGLLAASNSYAGWPVASSGGRLRRTAGLGGSLFSLTNSITASAPRQYYALQVAPPSDALWIPPCGAWLGAEVTNGSTQAFSDHEAILGRQLDILRIYHTPGSWTALTSEELAYINAGRKLLVSFKPNSYWSNAVGVAASGSASVDSQLTSLARSVAGIKPRKMMLCVWHEPENDVGSAGTTNQYMAMWQNVRSIFDSNGAINVIWCWVIENYAPFHYLLPGLWPGNSYVDWVGWDVYKAQPARTTSPLKSPLTTTS